ncbi:MAG: translational GTPase TypA [Limnochordia bacterium]|jgi:GTP-binding protein
MEIRNVAIIAHVDHGKTTLVDALLKETGVFRENQKTGTQILDSNALERERGITILSKNTGIFHNETKINIVDTPGHSDFGGEVERVIGMVDGALLVVDAAEGPLPQTRYVLQKAFKYNLRPIVVINKIDRKDARPYEVLEEVLDLFLDLDATEEQADFPVVWAVAREGVASLDLEDAQAQLAGKKEKSILPLLDLILEHVPQPTVDPDGPLQLLATNLEYDEYVGRLVVGRIQRGTLRRGMPVTVCRSDADWKKTAKVEYLYTFARLERTLVEEAGAGEIVAVAGIDDVSIGDTIVDPNAVDPLPALKVDEPTLTVIFRVNDGPLAGRDGKYITSRHIRDRLWREAQTNVALRVNPTGSPDAFEVRGRGELHLGILIETMRREGYEFTVSRPQPVLKEIDGQLQEPLERVFVEVPAEYSGGVILFFGQRKGEMLSMMQNENTVKLEFVVPARGLVGFHSQFLTETRGYGVVYHTYYGYGPHRGPILERTTGSLVAYEPGTATAYAIVNAQERATLFIEPGTEVYEGMIIGENSRSDDLDVNIAKKKHVSNMRSATSDIAEKIDVPRKLTLEQALAFIASDELVEVTPKTIRLRKQVLDQSERYMIRKQLAAKSLD